MALLVVGKILEGRDDGTRTAKSKSTQPFGGVGPASGGVPEQWAAGKRMVRRTQNTSIHVL